MADNFIHELLGGVGGRARFEMVPNRLLNALEERLVELSKPLSQERVGEIQRSVELVLRRIFGHTITQLPPLEDHDPGFLGGRGRAGLGWERALISVFDVRTDGFLLGKVIGALCSREKRPGGDRPAGFVELQAVGNNTCLPVRAIMSISQAFQIGNYEGELSKIGSPSQKIWNVQRGVVKKSGPQEQPTIAIELLHFLYICLCSYPTKWGESAFCSGGPTLDRNGNAGNMVRYDPLACRSKSDFLQVFDTFIKVAVPRQTGNGVGGGTPNHGHGGAVHGHGHSHSEHLLLLMVEYLFDTGYMCRQPGLLYDYATSTAARVRELIDPCVVHWVGTTTKSEVVTTYASWVCIFLLVSRVVGRDDRDHIVADRELIDSYSREAQAQGPSGRSPPAHAFRGQHQHQHQQQHPGHLLQQQQHSTHHSQPPHAVVQQPLYDLLRSTFFTIFKHSVSPGEAAVNFAKLRLAVDCWLRWIFPWKAGKDGRYGDPWRLYVASNLHFYTTLLVMFLRAMNALKDPAHYASEKERHALLHDVLTAFGEDQPLLEAVDLLVAKFRFWYNRQGLSRRQKGGLLQQHLGALPPLHGSAAIPRIRGSSMAMAGGGGASPVPLLTAGAGGGGGGGGGGMARRRRSSGSIHDPEIEVSDEPLLEAMRRQHLALYPASDAAGGRGQAGVGGVGTGTDTGCACSVDDFEHDGISSIAEECAPCLRELFRKLASDKAHNDRAEEQRVQSWRLKIPASLGIRAAASGSFWEFFFFFLLVLVFALFVAGTHTLALITFFLSLWCFYFKSQHSGHENTFRSSESILHCLRMLHRLAGEEDDSFDIGDTQRKPDSPLVDDGYGYDGRGSVGGSTSPRSPRGRNSELTMATGRRRSSTAYGMVARGSGAGGAAERSKTRNPNWWAFDAEDWKNSRRFDALQPDKGLRHVYRNEAPGAVGALVSASNTLNELLRLPRGYKRPHRVEDGGAAAAEFNAADVASVEGLNEPSLLPWEVYPRSWAEYWALLSGKGLYCWRCGASDHVLVSECTEIRPGGGMFGAADNAYASCFLCLQKGHLSFQCPEKPTWLVWSMLRPFFYGPCATFRFNLRVLARVRLLGLLCCAMLYLLHSTVVPLLAYSVGAYPNMWGLLSWVVLLALSLCASLRYDSTVSPAYIFPAMLIAGILVFMASRQDLFDGAKYLAVLGQGKAADRNFFFWLFGGILGSTEEMQQKGGAYEHATVSKSIALVLYRASYVLPLYYAWRDDSRAIDW